MRTALDIDEDVFAAAKERARREHTTAGVVASEPLRQALTTPVVSSAHIREAAAVYGFQLFPSRGRVVTNEVIDQLRNDDVC